MEHLSFFQLVVPRFSHPNPVSSFYRRFSLAQFSQGCPSPGLLLPRDLGTRPALGVNNMEFIINGATSGSCSQPSPTADPAPLEV